jgi:tetratricopeptide (TPR) repeat protein
LGLIYNDLYRPQEALRACAHAYAIAQSFNDARAIGLTLTQLSEALRRLAGLDLLVRQDSPVEIYHEAERAIQQAREIFLESSASQESVRLVEVNIETGCLYRDWLGETDKSQSLGIWQRRYDDALFYLQEAVRVAKKLDILRLTLDAQVNIAWTYFAAKDYEAAEAALQEAEQLVPPDAQFRKKQLPADPNEHDSFIFKQLSKAMGLYGLMTLMQFKEKLEILETKIPGLSQEKRIERRLLVRDDKEMQALLEKAASYYVRALGYAQLFAPRSAALTIIYDRLYTFLKQLNQRELEDFYEYSRDARKLYQTDEIKIRNLGNLSEFLLENFGDYNEPEPNVPIPAGAWL